MLPKEIFLLIATEAFHPNDTQNVDTLLPTFVLVKVGGPDLLENLSTLLPFPKAVFINCNNLFLPSALSLIPNDSKNLAFKFDFATFSISLFDNCSIGFDSRKRFPKK